MPQTRHVTSLKIVSGPASLVLITQNPEFQIPAFQYGVILVGLFSLYCYVLELERLEGHSLVNVRNQTDPLIEELRGVRSQRCKVAPTAAMHQPAKHPRRPWQQLCCIVTLIHDASIKRATWPR